MHAQSALWAWGTSMYLDIKFHQYVTYVLAGCLENIFWNYRKLGFFVHTKNVTSFFLSKPCHIDKLRLVKYEVVNN